MNLPENQSTKQKINKSAYDDIKSRYKSYATYWNAIWKVWQGTSPTWGSDAWGNFLNQEIPVSERYSNKVTYSGQPGEINPNIASIESNIIETLSNQNITREEVRKFNTLLMEKFKEYEYNSAGKTLYSKPIKSYTVKYITENVLTGEKTEEILYTNEYEKFSDNYFKVGNTYKNSSNVSVESSDLPKVQLYRDEKLTNSYGNIFISITENNLHKYVVWTGERYYQQVDINQFTRISNEPYSSPTNMTSNDSKGLIVSCGDLGGNTYKLFNGSEDLSFRDSNNAGTISNDRPVIIYFNTEKEICLKKYSLKSDSYGSYPKSWYVEGSNTKDSWTRIDKRTGQSFSKNETKTISLTNSEYFQYHRIVITSYNVATVRKRRIFGYRTTNYVALRKFSFNGYSGYTTINSSAVQTQNLGKAFAGQATEFDNIKTYANSISTNDFEHFSEFKSTEVDNVNDKNLQELKLYDRSSKVTLNNVENGTRQDNLIRKEDTEQIKRVLDKINAVLKLRDGWFDKSGRCSLSCQVQCQHGCQVSCQHCNTHQCHNQKCGAH